MSGLVEKVRGIIEAHIAACEPPDAIARAAIAAVAEWLKEKNYKTTHVPDWHTVAQIARQLEQPK